MKRTIVLTMCLAVCAGASASPSDYRPIVDARDVERARYESDLQDYPRYALQVDPAQNAAAGANTGALLSAAVSAVLGGYDNSRSGAAGAIVGGVSGAAQGAGDQVNIIRRCMAGRGYSVLA